MLITAPERERGQDKESVRVCVRACVRACSNRANALIVFSPRSAILTMRGGVLAGKKRNGSEW